MTCEPERLARDDVVVGIAASGTTPYVLGALAFARKRGATTVAHHFQPERRSRG